MTWDMLGVATRALSQMVADDGYEPDMILGIARGGLLPAGAMAYALSVKNVYTMNVKFYTGKMLDGTTRLSRGDGAEAIHSLPAAPVAGIPELPVIVVNPQCPHDLIWSQCAEDCHRIVSTKSSGRTGTWTFGAFI